MNRETRRDAEEKMKLGCARKDEGNCHGRLTVQHCFGRVRQKPWKQIILCENCHQGDNQNKKKDKWLALRQATSEELDAEPKANYRQELNYLNSIYDKQNTQ